MERYGWNPSLPSGKNPAAGSRYRESWNGPGSLRQPESSGQQVIRYDRYRLKLWEAALGLAKGVAACALLSYTFYRSRQAFLLMLPGSLAGIFLERRARLERRRKKLAEEFKESMVILASSLAAGYSMENALKASVEELETLYGREGLVAREFSYMVQQLGMNRPVEGLLADFALRSGLEDIQSFADVFAVAKRSSGDLGSIMRHTAEVIRDKMQVREEIITLTASRQFEQKIMNLIPFFIVFYVESASPGFFSQMYGTGLGRMLMSGCLAVYLVSCVTAKRILAIEV